METKEKTNQSNTQAPDTKYQNQPLKVKAIDGKPLIVRGVVDKITTKQTKFGYTSTIEMHGAYFYFHHKTQDAVDKMFKVGDKAAFTVKESKSSTNDKVFLTIDTVFYCL